MSDQIISTELPPALHDGLIAVDSRKAFEAGQREFIEAQRSAILRFCEAVEQKVNAIESNYTTLWRDAVWQLRAELIVKENA